MGTGKGFVAELPYSGWQNWESWSRRYAPLPTCRAALERDLREYGVAISTFCTLFAVHCTDHPQARHVAMHYVPPGFML